MAKTLTSKLILLVLGIGLLSQWLHLSELAAHSERIATASVGSQEKHTPASQASLLADDCSSPISHEDSQDHAEDCVVGCHTHCHSNCRPAVLAAHQLDHALSILHAGVSSENILISDPHYGSLLRPPAA